MLSHQDQIPNIVFSDESRFQKGPDNSWRRIKRGNWNETCFVNKEKFTEGIMVWGAIGLNFRSELIHCSNHEGAEEYINILNKSNVIENCDVKFGRYKWTFMQDGAPCHTASSTIKWLKERVVLVPGWPPNSQDLNPIEILWGIIKKKLKKKRWEKSENICNAISEIWNSFDEKVINALVSDFLRRCRIVLNLGGNSASQYISSHRKEVLLKDRVPYVSLKPWSDFEDFHLMQLQNENGNRWAKICSILGRSADETRRRYRLISQIKNNERLRNKHLFPPLLLWMNSWVKISRIFCLEGGKIPGQKWNSISNKPFSFQQMFLRETLDFE